MTASPGQVSLVIGGTGMLAAATLWLADHSGATIVVARRASAFCGGDERLLPVDVDWNSAEFRERVSAAVDRMGPVTSALLWLHEPEPVLQWLLPRIAGARVVLVLGSQDGRPELPTSAKSVVAVRLGSMATSSGRRWLTDDEICAGVIVALQDGRPRVIGELVPPR